jgi:hypothetical protein
MSLLDTYGVPGLGAQLSTLSLSNTGDLVLEVSTRNHPSKTLLAIDAPHSHTTFLPLPYLRLSAVV